MFLLEYWMRPRGFGGQTWYLWAWQYVAYAHFAFWGTPILGFVSQAAGWDSILGTLVWYLEVLSIGELVALGAIAEIMLRISVMQYTKNDTIKLDEVKRVEQVYVTTYVMTVVLVENMREGALKHAKHLLEEQEKEESG